MISVYKHITLCVLLHFHASPQNHFYTHLKMFYINLIFDQFKVIYEFCII